MKKPMTIEEALEDVIDAAKWLAEEYKLEKIFNAISFISDGEEPVEKSADSECIKCNECSVVYELQHSCPSCGCSSWNSNHVQMSRKTWIETRTIKIVDVETDVKFEEVD